jgi:mannobiose 2-epimerase
MNLATLRSEIESELRCNLLPFWRDRSVDHTRGGFIARMTSDGTLIDDASKGLILNARLLWGFAALIRKLGEPRDAELARRAFDYLKQHFRDSRHGGYRWRVGGNGRPLDESKKTYGQAFCIYALSEHALATGDSEVLDAARALFELIEQHARDHIHGGYFEARAADWSATDDLRLSDKDMVAAKSMNTHLHLLEAYTNLYRAWPDPLVAMRLRELIAIFGSHIVDLGPGPHHGHLRHFFDEGWGLLSDTYTYGHDIEAVWLISEAAEVLDDRELEATVGGWAVEIARAVLGEGVDADGGLASEGRDSEVTNPDRDWWCQAEAVVGFEHAFELTGETAFAAASEGAWRFIDRSVVDRVHGEWFWRVMADGSVDEREPKVSEWKGPYHSVRMCLEMMRRLDRRGNRE